jgi:four helix bundle protein
MNSAKRFEDLEVWKEARELTKLVYEITGNGKFKSDLRLRNQMRDAGVSIIANVAEGFSRRSDKEFRRFLLISKGSGSELQSHGYVSLDQK